VQEARNDKMSASVMHCPVPNDSSLEASLSYNRRISLLEEMSYTHHDEQNGIDSLIANADYVTLSYYCRPSYL
jgi:hypothetical protein